jgi:sarcosine oxidase subunit alpha
MSKVATIIVNGARVAASEECSVAAAILGAGISGFRKSVSGESRGPLCGMGICFECRVTIDGTMHSRSCQIACRDGMVILTDD